MIKMAKKCIFHSNQVCITPVYFYKELGEIVYYFTKLYEFDGILDDCRKDDVFRNVKLHTYPFRNLFPTIRKLIYVFTHAKEIDVLYLITIIPDNLFKMIAYRLGGGKGKIYLKLDLGIYAKNGKDLLVWENMSYLLKVFHYLFKPLPDVYTVETKRSYERLRNSYYSDLIEKGKLFRLPNGFDSEILEEIGVTRRKVSEKEKVMMAQATSLQLKGGN